MQVVVKCLHFVMSYMKQNIKQKHLQTLESEQHRLEIIFNDMHPKIFISQAQLAAVQTFMEHNLKCKKFHLKHFPKQRF